MSRQPDRPIVALLVLLLLALLAAPALAQRSKGGTAKKEPVYPNAQREEPKISISQRFGRKFKQMADLSDKDKFAEMLEIAEQVAADAKATKADRAAALQNAAYAAMELDDYERALGHIDAALATDALPNDTHFGLMLQAAQIRIQEEQYDAGLTLLDRFMAETRSDKPDHLALKGNALYRMDRFPEAAATLKAALAAKPDAPDSWRQLLMATYIDMEQPLEAVKIAEELAARSPEDKRALSNVAAIYGQADLYDKAAEVLERIRAKGMFTEERDYRQLYAIYLNAENQERKAIEVINEGLAKGVIPETAEVYTALGQAYYFSDQFEPALAAYAKAAPLAKDGEAGLNLARLLSNEERHADARDAARAALAKGLRRPGDAWIIIGRAEFGLNNRAGMVAAYKEAAKYPETAEQARDWLRRSGKM